MFVWVVTTKVVEHSRFRTTTIERSVVFVFEVGSTDVLWSLISVLSP